MFIKNSLIPKDFHFSWEISHEVIKWFVQLKYFSKPSGAREADCPSTQLLHLLQVWQHPWKISCSLSSLCSLQNFCVSPQSQILWNLQGLGAQLFVRFEQPEKAQREPWPLGTVRHLLPCVSPATRMIYTLPKIRDSSGCSRGYMDSVKMPNTFPTEKPSAELGVTVTAQEHLRSVGKDPSQITWEDIALKYYNYNLQSPDLKIEINFPWKYLVSSA